MWTDDLKPGERLALVIVTVVMLVAALICGTFL